MKEIKLLFLPPNTTSILQPGIRELLRKLQTIKFSEEIEIWLYVKLEHFWSYSIDFYLKHYIELFCICWI